MITIRNFEYGDAAALQLAVYTERSVEEIEEMICLRIDGSLF